MPTGRTREHSQDTSPEKSPDPSEGKPHDKSQDHPHDKSQRNSKGNGQGSSHQHSSASHSSHSSHFSLIKDIRPSSPVKHNQVFMLLSDGSDIVAAQDAQGLYYHDMRHLDMFEAQINGKGLLALLSDAAAGNSAVYELTNQELQTNDGRTLSKELLSIRRHYALQSLKLEQNFSIRSLDQLPVEVDVTFAFSSSFTDVFVIRGQPEGKRGTLRKPEVRGRTVTLAYDGADEHVRRTTLHFDPAPDALDGELATYTLHLEPRETTNICITISVEDQGPLGPSPVVADRAAAAHAAHADAHRALHEALGNRPKVVTDNPLFERTLARSFADLQMLATADHGDVYVAGGVPWYVALFGRDSLITAYEVLAYQPRLARDTLRVFAAYQGRRYDDFQDEQPGKMLHELRMGEQANLHEIPQIPSYATVDATPWYLVLLSEYVNWTGDIALFEQLRPTVEAALGWMDENLARHGTEFLAYGERGEMPYTNKGWKDSTNGIVNSDGSLARPPIQLVEVQGYAYAAKLGIARLMRATGDEAVAARLEQQAADLKARFNERFWMEDAAFYAMALQASADGERGAADTVQVRAIASNPGQALVGGIVDEARTAAVVERLMRDDMYCGWGIRTLSSAEVAYNPLDYQVGAVWPHDNALIVLGFWRSGHVAEALQVFDGIFQAATRFEHYRLPELFDGFSRKEYSTPVHYPVACSPQAWAAGSVPLLLQTCLGLQPDALRHTLRIVRPHIPDWLGQVEVSGLRVGDASVDLHYTCDADFKNTLVAVTRLEGELHIVIEP